MGSLSDYKFKDSPNPGMMPLNSSLINSYAFSAWVGEASTHPERVQISLRKFGKIHNFLIHNFSHMGKFLFSGYIGASESLPLVVLSTGLALLVNNLSRDSESWYIEMVA